MPTSDPSARAACDLLITGATAIVDADTVIDDAVIAIRDGVLASVGGGGASGLVARERLHLPGRIVMPGFVNIHTHAALSMLRGVAEDLGFAPAYTPGVPGGADLTPGEAGALARLGALEALRFGSTTIVDTYVHAGATAPAMAELGGRVCASPRIHDADLGRLGKGEWHFDPHIGAQTLDEALRLAERWPRHQGARISAHLAAHAADTCSAALLEQIRDASVRLRIPVATHLAQSRAEVAAVRERAGCTPAQLLDRLGLLGPQLIAAHCIHLDDADVARCGAAGIHVAHIPKGNATGGTMAPTVRLAAAGAHLALGTDNMHADIIEVMRWALAVARLQDGAVSARWQPAHVFAMATQGGAAALGLADQLGTLAAGKRADLVIVDARAPHLAPLLRPLGSLVHVGQGRDVDYVLVDGEIVIAAGRPTRVDMDAVVAEATAAAESVWQRVGGRPARAVARVPA